MKWFREWLYPDLEKQAEAARHANWLRDQNASLVTRTFSLEARLADLYEMKMPTPPQNEGVFRCLAALEHDYTSLERDFNALAAENAKNKRVADAFRELLELVR